MEKTVKCAYCRKESVIDIPEIKVVSMNWRQILEKNHDEYVSFDIRNLACPHCNVRGGLVVPYKKSIEKIINISSHNKTYYYLSFKYPVKITKNNKFFKTYEELYLYKQLANKDKPKFLKLTKLTEKRKFIENSRMLEINKQELIYELVKMRIEEDKKFKDLLKSTVGHELRYSSDDMYLGFRQSGVRRHGENMYGKILSKISYQLNNEDLV